MQVRFLTGTKTFRKGSSDEDALVRVYALYPDGVGRPSSWRHRKSDPREIRGDFPDHCITKSVTVNIGGD